MENFAVFCFFSNVMRVSVVKNEKAVLRLKRWVDSRFGKNIEIKPSVKTFALSIMMNQLGLCLCFVLAALLLNAILNVCLQIFASLLPH